MANLREINIRRGKAANPIFSFYLFNTVPFHDTPATHCSEFNIRIKNAPLKPASSTNPCNMSMPMPLAPFLHDGLYSTILDTRSLKLKCKKKTLMV